MKNRIAHVLKDWNPEVHAADTGTDQAVPPAGAVYPPPRGVNMLMPVELCINRDLLITLLSSSIQQMHRQKRSRFSAITDHSKAEFEAALQQLITLLNWAREHPANFICIALYPTTEAGTAEDLEDLGDF